MSADVVLPSELWLTIFSYLDYKDILSCSSVNLVFYDLCQHASIWRPLCNKYWLDNNSPPERSWKEHFILWFRDYGRYIDCYRFLKKAWSDFLEFIEVQCPCLARSVRSGVSEEDLDELALELNCELPNEYRCFYRIHNANPEHGHFGSEVFGSVVVYDLYRAMNFIDFGFLKSRLKEVIRVKGCLPLIWCPSTGYIEFMPLMNHEALSKDYVYNTLFENMGHRDIDLRRVDVYISGKSVTNWFTTFVDSVTKGLFSITPKQILRFYHEPGCVEKTNSIEVTAATVFMSELSRVAVKRFVHSYRITLTMDKAAKQSEACKLLTRHWIITDENDEEERVDGEGVVGEFPILRPGDTYSWASLTTFKTTYGNMKGHFKMVNLKTGIKFNLHCPVFHMKCLPYVRQ